MTAGTTKMTLVGVPSCSFTTTLQLGHIVPIMKRPIKSGSRSMPRVAPIAFAVAIVAFALPAKAQQSIDFSKVEIKTIDLGHNTYRLEGQGGNITVAATLEKSMFCCAFAGSANATWSADDQDDRVAASLGQFGTTSAPRWPHSAHTKPSPSDLIRVSSGRWPTFMIVL
jgi:hypothetical protein